MTFWTAERITELVERWNKANQTASQICLAMNAPSRNSVISKVHRLGLAVRATKHANSERRSNGSGPRKADRRHSRSHTATAPCHQDKQSYRYAATDFTRLFDSHVTALPVFKNAKPLLALQNHDCRWPTAGHGAGLLFCAAPVADGHPYCLAHCRLAYAPAVPSHFKKSNLKTGGRST